MLTFGVVALFFATSCEKKESTKIETPTTENSTAADEKAASEIPKTINGVEVPKFSSPEVQQFADEYATFMSEMTAASKSGDAAKIQELSLKTQEWAEKQTELASKWTPEDAKLWSDFAMKLSQAQMPK